MLKGFDEIVSRTLSPRWVGLPAREDTTMKRGLLTITLAIVLSGVLISPAYAGDEFEKGFKLELGAIAARSAVGIGVGVVRGILGGGVVHATPAPVAPVYVAPPVVYAPPPPPVIIERRVYYRPYYAPPPPPRVYYHRYYY